MRSSILAALTLALACAACGNNDICDRYVAEAKNGIEEATACGATTSATYNAAACKQAETGCSEADKKTIGIYLDCGANVKSPSCTEFDVYCYPHIGRTKLAS